MALLDDILKGDMLTGLAVGLGIVLIAPVAGQVLRPAAKAVVKGGILAYHSVGAFGEAVGDIVAKVQHELTEAEPESAGLAASSRSRPKPGKPVSGLTLGSLSRRRRNSPTIQSRNRSSRAATAGS